MLSLVYFKPGYIVHPTRPSPLCIVSGKKKAETMFLPLTLPNADRFSKSFHRDVAVNSTKAIIKYPIQVAE